jgi:DnaJ-class molecular chaperone
MMVCPKCEGRKVIAWVRDLSSSVYEYIRCPTCKGTGLVNNDVEVE